jgi:gluconolactonase
MEQMGNVEARSDAIWELLDEDATLDEVGTGFTFTEGPIWNPEGGYLLFSDMPGNVRRKYTPGIGVVEMRNPSNKCNGMTYDQDLNLIVCEHVTSSLMMEKPDGTIETLASHFEGKELNSPNDVCVRSDGSIYFSDPWYGRMPIFGEERERDLGFQGVYRIPPGRGDLELVVDRDEYEQPNGLCFSPDESLLYLNDTPRALIDVFDVNADGSLSNGRRFAENIGSGVIEDGIPDGMKCDERGNIWVTGPGGVWIFSAEGEHLGKVLVPQNVGNLTWGGDDWKTLYMPSSTSLYTMRTKVGPHREPYMG